MTKAFPEGQESSPRQEDSLKMFLAVFSLLGASLVGLGIKPTYSALQADSLLNEENSGEQLAAEVTHSSHSFWGLPRWHKW